MKLNELLGTEFPFIQGGMANIATGEFAAAVSNAGALGLIGAGGMTPDSLRENIRRCRELTDRPFGVNVMLLSPFAPVQVLIMTLLIQARHLFYGISMLDKYKGMGWKKGYLIFGMCDETFSINYTAEIPDGVDKGWFFFFVTLLNHFYWFSGATIGGLVGSLLKFDTTGISFVMTAMFVVIFLEQWLKEKHHAAPWIGLLASVVCLVCFGADSFLIPTMAAILLTLLLCRRKLERTEKKS